MGNDGMMEASTMNCEVRMSIGRDKRQDNTSNTRQVSRVEALRILISDGSRRDRTDLGGPHPMVRAHSALNSHEWRL